MKFAFSMFFALGFGTSIRITKKGISLPKLGISLLGLWDFNTYWDWGFHHQLWKFLLLKDKIKSSSVLEGSIGIKRKMGFHYWDLRFHY